ncbi:hypothetical protein KUTeg_017410 [Tegillarca granosa]|uniref:Uncharacterized protein n=1 Tax=Tegillarca granosa TaxID=220873 RepID=A0ABQ9EN56_TEGGR|nr:hypothetical protein KUTeg_017410 [Tegillarca granosa]
MNVKKMRPSKPIFKLPRAEKLKIPVEEPILHLNSVYGYQF